MEESTFIKQLVSFLIDRGYEPGERIPSERELGTRFDVGRSQVRETISYLEALRVIERRPKSGLFMAEEKPSVEALALFARIGVPLNAEDVRQMVELRMIHEVEAVKLACARRTTENTERMRQILAESAVNSTDPEATALNDRLFHSEIVRSTQNDVFLRVVDIFYLMSAPRRVLYFQDRERRDQSRREHQRLLDAIVARDETLAVDLIKQHLQGVDSYWRGFIAQDQHVDGLIVE